MFIRLLHLSHAVSRGMDSSWRFSKRLINEICSMYRNFSETRRHRPSAQCAINEISNECISAIDHYEVVTRFDILVMVYRSNNRQHTQ